MTSNLGVLLNRNEAKPVTLQIRKFRVFPDYQSTGIWDYYTGNSASSDEAGLTKQEELALQMWHDIWEYCLYDENWNKHDFPLTQRMSDNYIKKHCENLHALFDAVNERLGYEGFVIDYNVQEGVKQ